MRGGVLTQKCLIIFASLFCYEGSRARNPKQFFRLLVRTYYRLRLFLFCVCGQVERLFVLYAQRLHFAPNPTASTLPSCLLCYSQPGRSCVRPIIKHTTYPSIGICFLGLLEGNVFYGGPGGHCPRVLNPFLVASYNHSMQYNTTITKCQPAFR